jgi:prevent-host-death family protein
MTTSVGIKMLKENLSAYVALAVQGEHIIITDRGREVAELGPLSADRQAMMALVEAGVASWSGRKPTLPSPLPIDVDMAGAIIEDRR